MNIQNPKNVTCPSCGEEFAVEQALRTHVEQELRAEIAAAMKAEGQAKMDALVAEKAEEQALLTTQIDALRADKKALSHVESAYKDLALEKLVLEDQRADDIARARKAQALQTKQELQAKLEAEQAEDDKARAEQRAEERRKDAEKLKKKHEALELKFKMQLAEEIDAKVSEKDQQLEKAKLEMQRLNDELQKIQQGQTGGHSELKGEAFEIAVENTLRDHFSDDAIEEIKKGAHGADLIQTVRNASRLPRGKIVWECKNHKVWNNDWTQKIRKDALDVGGDAKVIVTTVMPKELEGQTFGQIEDVFVCQYAVVPVVGTLLRDAILNLAKERTVQASLPTIQGQLLDYIRSDEFTNVLRMVTKAYTQFDEDLRKEEAYMKTRWKTRRKYLANVIDGITSMAGSITAIGGGELDLNAELFERPRAALEMDAEE